MTGPQSGDSELELGVLFNACQNNFAAVLRAMSGNSPSQQLRMPIVDRAFDEYARLRIWSQDFRAALPDQMRSSLGDTLRQDSELRSQVVSIFEMLNRQLKYVLSMLSGSTEWDGDDSSDSESLPSTGDSGNDGGQRAILRQISNIFDQVQLLYNLGILLRRPGLKRRYLKSDLASSHSHFHDAAPEDLSHVAETIRRWRKDTDEWKGLLPDEESPVTWAELWSRAQAGLGPENTGWLAERLARANTRRRAQLMYWGKNPDQVLGRELATSTEAEIPNRPHQSEGGLEDAKSIRSKGTTLFSRNTVAKSDLLGHSADPPTRSNHTVYAETVLGRAHATRVPSVPKGSKEGGTFECPYCHLQLDSAFLTENRDAWKRHVFRDLRPYVCTFPSCPSEDKMYASRHDWVYHEMQVHRRQWDCTDCQETFYARGDMASHVALAHAGHPQPAPSRASLDLYERPLDDTFRSACPLCPVSDGIRSLLQHLGRHMEELSLFVLPHPDDDGNEDEDGSTKPPTKADDDSAVETDQDAEGQETGMPPADTLAFETELPSSEDGDNPSLPPVEKAQASDPLDRWAQIRQNAALRAELRARGEQPDAPGESTGKGQHGDGQPREESKSWLSNRRY
ncbi:hypothetical protein B0T25DRAFT_560394 [Lasiosphaeria hispida]|uniref:C2H2-type domain-containing protein n=1 Tax=Lasiosphaeria hispida TaxID=260671 RepID=A0AAJ0H4Y0_9PEZI|nr:hypothetical protein B0T25DRAFT_560394 [Lasiosphaeria hispida]